MLLVGKEQSEILQIDLELLNWDMTAIVRRGTGMWIGGCKIG